MLLGEHGIEPFRPHGIAPTRNCADTGLCPRPCLSLSPPPLSLFLALSLPPLFPSLSISLWLRFPSFSHSCLSSYLSFSPTSISLPNFLSLPPRFSFTLSPTLSLYLSLSLSLSLSPTPVFLLNFLSPILSFSLSLSLSLVIPHGWNPVWAQSCMGAIPCGRNPAWAPFLPYHVIGKINIEKWSYKHLSNALTSALLQISNFAVSKSPIVAAICSGVLKS